MKNSIFAILIMAGLLSVSSEIFAQGRMRQRQEARPRNTEQLAPGPRYQQGGCLIENMLTEEQKEELASQRTTMLASGVQHRNQMAELQARKRTLMTQSDPDMKAIDSVIDQMERLRSARMKEMAAHHQKIRSMLNDEQRAIFDNRGIRGQQMRQGNRNYRQCPGRQF